MLNLVLNGTNTITTGNVTDAKECYGIYLSMNDTLKISGTGTLKVTAGIAMDDSMGILTGSLKMEQGSVEQLQEKKPYVKLNVSSIMLQVKKQLVK